MAEETPDTSQVKDVVQDQKGKAAANPVTEANKYRQHKDNPAQNPLPGPQNTE